MSEQNTQEIQKMTDIAVEALEDIKAENIQILETEELSALFSRLIIASGNSNRQLRALAVNVSVRLKEAGFQILGIEGLDGGEWALVDAGDLVIHIMLPAVREHYDIDSLWGGQKPNR